MPSRVQHAVYTIGTVNIHHVIQMMIKTVIRLPILALVFYPITPYQGHFMKNLICTVNFIAIM